jgi:hypothetical protein
MDTDTKQTGLLQWWNNGFKRTVAPSFQHFATASSKYCADRSVESAVVVRLRYGRALFRVVAAGLMFAGAFALVQSVTGRFLPQDLRYLRMDMQQLCGISNGRVAHFMFHDRVSFGGALIAMAVLYLWLERVPLKQGACWAWWTLLLSGITGFGSFLAYLGYGYLDSLHGLATLTLFPLYAGGLLLTRSSLLQNPQAVVENERSMKSWCQTQLGWGRALLLATASGLVLGGTTIMLVGMTRVFVPQDLRYLGLGAAELLAINNRLVPLIAHDRASFGGAIATCGVLLFSCVWFGQPSRNLWRAVLLSGCMGFCTAIVVHPLIGYTDFSHLAPAYLGVVMFSVGISLSFRPMCRGNEDRASCGRILGFHMTIPATHN